MKKQLVVGQMQIKMNLEKISLDPASVTGFGEGPDLELSSVAVRHNSKSEDDGLAIKEIGLVHLM